MNSAQNRLSVLLDELTANLPVQYKAILNPIIRGWLASIDPADVPIFCDQARAFINTVEGIYKDVDHD